MELGTVELLEFAEELERFIEDRNSLSKEDDDFDEYRAGYRSGYYDALMYLLDWIQEET